MGLGSSHDLDVNHIDAVLGGAGLQASMMSCSSLLLTMQHLSFMKRERGRTRTPFT